MSETIGQVADQLEGFKGALQELVAGLSEEQLYYRPGPEECSIAEVVGHLEDVDALIMGRIALALTQEQPPMPVYEEKGPVKARNFQGQPFDALMDAFLARRTTFVGMLRELQPEQLTRFGIHPMHGELSVDRIPRSPPKHDNTHRGQIEGNVASYRTAGA